MATVAQPQHASEPCRWPAREELEEKLRDARRVVTNARHSAEDLAADAASTVRRHSLRSISAVMFAGAVAGFAVGFCAGFRMGRPAAAGSGRVFAAGRRYVFPSR
jgi:ferric-dicitrate binding protein FerR (iron transport regulator)